MLIITSSAMRILYTYVDRKPNVGVISSPANNSTLYNNRSEIRMAMSDPDGNALSFKLQFVTEATFTNVDHGVKSVDNPTYL